MPFASGGRMSLRSILRSRHAGRADANAQYLEDETTKIPVHQLACGCAQAELVASLYGTRIMLATERQVETISAVAQLDGVARRIVLWPQDRPKAQIESVLKAAGIDHVINAWPLTCGHDAFACGDARALAAEAFATEYVLFTSGTTSRPKMVVHTLESLAGHLRAGAATDAVWATYYDIARYGGLQVGLRALFGGGSLVLSGAPDEKPAAFLARAGRAGVTHMLGTPSHWRRALMSDAVHAIAPRYVRLSGEVADQTILDQLAATYPSAQIVHAFASTEAGLAFEVDDRCAGFPTACIGTTGPTTLAVKDGTLRVRSPRNAAGYLDGRISCIADAEGYVDTGDVVEVLHGRYHFVGRRDGIINVGGQKVHPEEVEAVINLHPEVRMSLVAGRPNPITGSVIVARIVPRTPSLPPAAMRLEDEIRALCRQHLPAHKIPAAISMVAKLDLSPAGKLWRARA
jgi:acyl-coenzyme A synthetase/AMP-(fatty) acid ligase